MLSFQKNGSISPSSVYQYCIDLDIHEKYYGSGGDISINLVYDIFSANKSRSHIGTCDELIKRYVLSHNNYDMKHKALLVLKNNIKVGKKIRKNVLQKIELEMAMLNLES